MPPEGISCQTALKCYARYRSHRWIEGFNQQCRLGRSAERTWWQMTATVIGGKGMPGLIHVVDDDTSFRTAIERRLRLAGYEVATYASAEQVLGRLPSGEARECILLDVQIPGLNGLDLQSRLNEFGLTVPIVFLTGHADTAATVRAIKAGAEDFLTKPVASQQLIEAIERALLRQEAVSSHRSKLDTLRHLVDSLTPRERQVFDLMVRGKINKQIAHELGTTERTIKAHRHQVMEKMRVLSFAELVSIAERLGMRD
jgi:RNA polymerase sigma factor (sigma-70 family)